MDEGNGSVTIVYVFDSLRYDHVGAIFDGERITPNMDGLVGDGCVVCRRHYSEATWTLPSISSMLCGRHPLVLGVRHRSDKLGGGFRRLPEFYRERGYRTVAVSANPYFDRAFNMGRGFDEFHALLTSAEFDAGNRNTIPTSKDVNDKIFEAIDGRGGRDLFIFAFSLDTHNPYYVRDAGFTRFAGGLEDEFIRLKHINGYTREEQFGVLRRIYRNMVAYCDRMVGELVEGLVERGLWSSTTLMLLGDHGESLSMENFGHYIAPVVEGIHVPLIIKHQGCREAEFVDGVTSMENVLATLVELDLGVRVDGMHTVFEDYRDFVYSSREGEGGRYTYEALTGEKIQFLRTRRTFLNRVREIAVKVLGKREMITYDGAYSLPGRERVAGITEDEADVLFEVNRAKLGERCRVEEIIRRGCLRI